jgi:hypothetical protein
MRFGGKMEVTGKTRYLKKQGKSNKNQIPSFLSLPASI